LIRNEADTCRGLEGEERDERRGRGRGGSNCKWWEGEGEMEGERARIEFIDSNRAIAFDVPLSSDLLYEARYEFLMSEIEVGNALVVSFLFFFSLVLFFPPRSCLARYTKFREGEGPHRPFR
jgi:hypothetical protein